MGGLVGTLHAEEGYGFVCAVLKESLFLFLSHRTESTLNCCCMKPSPPLGLVPLGNRSSRERPSRWAPVQAGSLLVGRSSSSQLEVRRRRKGRKQFGE